MHRLCSPCLPNAGNLGTSWVILHSSAFFDPSAPLFIIFYCTTSLVTYFCLQIDMMSRVFFFICLLIKNMAFPVILGTLSGTLSQPSPLKGEDISTRTNSWGTKNRFKGRYMQCPTIEKQGARLCCRANSCRVCAHSYGHWRDRKVSILDDPELWAAWPTLP